MERARQELYGRVPLASQCDGHTSEAGELQTWSGIADPFGFKKGQNLRIKLEYVISYFGSKGVVRENTITVKDNAALTSDGFPAFDRFGPAERMRPSGARCLTTRLTRGLLQVVDDTPSSETTDALTAAVPLPLRRGGLLLVVASVDGNPTISNLPWVLRHCSWSGRTVPPRRS
jgi:hypothetical protein